MKIALVYDCLYPYSKGGVEKRLFDLAQQVCRTHEVHLLGMQYWKGGTLLKNGEVTYHGVCRSMSLYTRNGKRRIFPALRFSLALFFALLKERFDLVDCQNIPYFPCFAAALACRLRNIPLVMTWYEVWGDYWYEYLGWKGFFGVILEKLAAQLTPHNVVISAHTRRNFQRLSRQPITLIPIGISLAAIDAVPPKAERFDLLYVGRLIPEKGVDGLIRCVAALDSPSIRCAIIGDGPERSHLEQLTEDLGVSKQISFLGFVPNVYAYMKSSKLFVLPSRREGFGIVVIEANACGLPVLLQSYPQNASTELIDRNGYICQDETEMTEKIAQLLGDESRRCQLSTHARATAERYDWGQIATRYCQFLSKVVFSP